jgi:hypothetical protein
MYDQILESESEWVLRSLDLTLRTISRLAEAAAETGDTEVVIAVRDLADHATIWADLLDTRIPTGVEREVSDLDAIEGAMLLARSTAGLAARYRAAKDRFSPEVRRAVSCCTADLDVHGRRAAEHLREAELMGLGMQLRSAWCRLPSRQEFVGSHSVRASRQSVERSNPARAPCPKSREGASSAA